MKMWAEERWRKNVKIGKNGRNWNQNKERKRDKQINSRIDRESERE